MKSKTKIEKQIQKKTNSNLVETIIQAKKKKEWLNVANIISGSRRQRPSINLDKIDKESKEGETILIPGKVLSEGNLSKKIKVVALNFSKKAKEKLLNAKCEVVTMDQEIKNNPEAKGIKILR